MGAPEKILFIDDCMPEPFAGFGYPRSAQIVAALLKLGHAVALYSCLSEALFDDLRLDSLGQFAWRSQAAIGLDACLRACDGRVKAILVSRKKNLESLARLPAVNRFLSPIIYDAECVGSIREVRRLLLNSKLDRKGAKAMVEEERNLASIADAVIAVSDREARFFDATHAGRISVVSYAPQGNFSGVSFDDRTGIAFLGGHVGRWDNMQRPAFPNEDAVAHYVQDIHRDVANKTGASLHIGGAIGARVGHICPEAPADATIAIHGVVPRLDRFFEKRRLLVVATRYGSGIPLKVLDGLRHGIPIVAYRHVASSLNLSEGSLFLARDTDEFRRLVIEAYSDRSAWEEVRTRGFVEVSRKYSCAGMSNALENSLRQACSMRRRPTLQHLAVAAG